MSIIAEIIEKNPPKPKAEIQAATEDLIADIQSGNYTEKHLEKLLYLHIGLIAKVYNQYSDNYFSETGVSKLKEGDIVSYAYEIMLPCAQKYDIEKGKQRFAFVGFFMQRLTWKISDEFLWQYQTVRLPGEAHKQGKRLTIEYDAPLETIEQSYSDYSEEDSYPPRWEAIHQYEQSLASKTEEDELDLTIYKLNYKNKNISKIARRLKITRERTSEGIRRTTAKMAKYYYENDFKDNHDLFY